MRKIRFTVALEPTTHTGLADMAKDNGRSLVGEAAYIITRRVSAATDSAARRSTPRKRKTKEAA
jgi:hypothetical protein